MAITRSEVRLTAFAVSIFFLLLALPQGLLINNIINKIDGKFEGKWHDVFTPVYIEILAILILIALVSGLGGCIWGESCALGGCLFIFIPGIFVGILALFITPWLHYVNLLDGEKVDGHLIGDWLIGYGWVMAVLGVIAFCHINKKDSEGETHIWKNFKNAVYVLSLGIIYIIFGYNTTAKIDGDNEFTWVEIHTGIWIVTIVKMVVDFLESSFKICVASDENADNGAQQVVMCIGGSFLSWLWVGVKVAGLVFGINVVIYYDQVVSGKITMTGVDMCLPRFYDIGLYALTSALLLIYAIFPQIGYRRRDGRVVDIIGNGMINAVRGIPGAANRIDLDTYLMDVAPDVENRDRIRKSTDPSKKLEGVYDTTSRMQQPTVTQPTVKDQRDIECEEATDGQDACDVCMENRPNCILIPCRHQTTCMNCAKKLSSCPICKYGERPGEKLKLLAVHLT